MVGFNDQRGFNLNPISVSGFMYSDDGGATFVDGGQLPSPGDFDAGDGTLFPAVFGDPEVKYLGGCTFVYSSILIAENADTFLAQTMGVHRSTDCGHTWTGPFEVLAATNPAFLGDGADKEFMDVDPDTGRLMMTWTNFQADGNVAILSAFLGRRWRELACRKSQDDRKHTRRRPVLRAALCGQWQCECVCGVAPVPVPGHVFRVRQFGRFRAFTG